MAFGLAGEEQVIVAIDGRVMEPDLSRKAGLEGLGLPESCNRGLDGGEETVAMDGRVMEPDRTRKVGLEGLRFAESCTILLMVGDCGVPLLVDLLMVSTDIGHAEADMVSNVVRPRRNAMLLNFLLQKSSKRKRGCLAI